MELETKEKQVAEVGDKVRVEFLGTVIEVFELNGKIGYKVVIKEDSSWSYEQTNARVYAKSIEKVEE